MCSSGSGTYSNNFTNGQNMEHYLELSNVAGNANFSNEGDASVNNGVTTWRLLMEVFMVRRLM